MDFFPGHNQQAEQLPESDQRTLAELYPATRKLVSFHLEPVHDADASAREGYPVYVDKPFIAVKNEGEKDFVAHEPTEEEIRRYKPQWDAFQAALNNRADPLHRLPGMTPGLKRTFEDVKIPTVQKLAAYEGELPDRLKPFRAIAQRWLRLGDKPRLRLIDGQLVEADA